MRKIFLALILSLFLTHSSHAEQGGNADIGPTQPPLKNPHPPVSAQDKKRVEFAKRAIETFFKEIDIEKYADYKSSPKDNFTSKDEACFKNPDCFAQDGQLMLELLGIRQAHGKVVELRHGHIIPWSFEDFIKENKVAFKPILKFANQGPTEPGVHNNANVVAMPKPLLQKDEYMIHFYAHYANSDQWHHLNVIVTEDEKGNLFLRHFFTTPLPPYGYDLPDGVVC